jgi:membrane associated rhomboid family serine protease
MGLYDRDYYRREGPSFLGSIASTGQVCKWLIIVNVVVFIVQLVTMRAQPDVDFDDGFVAAVSPFGWFTDLFMLDAPAVLHGQVWRLLTYAFLHDPHRFSHILFNMLALWIFGTDMEAVYGRREFLAFYLLSAVAGGLASVAAWTFGLATPFCLGASGATVAVTILFAMHFPTREIYIFGILPMQAWLLAAVMVLADSFGLISGINRGVAVAVHLGGAAFAFLYYKSQVRVSGLWPDWRGWWRARTRPRLRVYREEPIYHAPVATLPPGDPDLDEHLEAKLDAVLEKVARYGQSSLTDSERKVLMRASEVYKKRRT